MALLGLLAAAWEVMVAQVHLAVGHTGLVLEMPAGPPPLAPQGAVLSLRAAFPQREVMGVHPWAAAMEASPLAGQTLELAMVGRQLDLLMVRLPTQVTAGLGRQQWLAVNLFKQSIDARRSLMLPMTMDEAFPIPAVAGCGHGVPRPVHP